MFSASLLSRCLVESFYDFPSRARSITHPQSTSRPLRKTNFEARGGKNRDFADASLAEELTFNIPLFFGSTENTTQFANTFRDEATASSGKK